MVQRTAAGYKTREIYLKIALPVVADISRLADQSISCYSLRKLLSNCRHLCFENQVESFLATKKKRKLEIFENQPTGRSKCEVSETVCCCLHYDCHGFDDIKEIMKALIVECNHIPLQKELSKFLD